MSGNELIIAISVEHVVVEIVDKTTNATVQTHDTRINKTFVMLFQGGAYRPPIVGSGGKGGSGRGGEEPKKKKIGLILMLCCVVFLAGLAITGWQLGWFEGAKENSPSVVTTANAIGNSTDNSSKKK
jgi:flagellar basal body-associated protein FliL